jgi:ketosteroid isomerase-like protein
MKAQILTEADVEEIRELFFRQARAETEHDIEAMDNEVLAKVAPGQPDPVNFVARAYRFWGREEVLEHFRTVFAGIWRFEPEAEEIKITAISADVAHIYAPTSITIGRQGGEETAYRFLVNEFAVRTPAGWRISTIVPVPAQ